MTSPFPPFRIEDHDLDEAEEQLDQAIQARLGAIGAFASVIRLTSWFTKLGQPLSADEIDLLHRCASATGFEAHPADIRDWEEAADVASTSDVNSPWWEAEESLRTAVTAEALDYFGTEDLEIAMTHVQATAADVIPNRIWDVATMWGMTNDSIIDAAVGHAISACHNAALLIATGATEDGSEDHAFSLKFKLYESGRWPIGVFGQSFMIF